MVKSLGPAAPAGKTQTGAIRCSSASIPVLCVLFLLEFTEISNLNSKYPFILEHILENIIVF